MGKKLHYHYVRVDDEPTAADIFAKMNKLGAEGYRVVQGANLGVAVIMEKDMSVDSIYALLWRLIDALEGRERTEQVSEPDSAAEECSVW